MEFSFGLHPYLRNLNHKVMKTLLSIIAFMLLTSMGQQAQVTIKGRVADQNDVPLSGVVVTVKGTNNSTTTDYDGKYSINVVPGSKILIFSLTGMVTLEEPIAGRTVVNVIMKPGKRPKPEKEKKDAVYDEVLLSWNGCRKARCQPEQSATTAPRLRRQQL